MRSDEEPQTQTRVIKRNTYQVFNSNSAGGEIANQCTMLVIGATVFFTGFWATVCLVTAVLRNGPLLMLKKLTTAVIGF